MRWWMGNICVFRHFYMSTQWSIRKEIMDCMNNKNFLRRFSLLIYFDLVLPFLYLYILPYFRMKAQKVYADTLNVSSVENAVAVTSLIFGISFAVFISLILKNRRSIENIIFLTIGIIILFTWNCTWVAKYLNYLPYKLYGNSFCVAHIGGSIYLIIYNIIKCAKN